MGLVLFVSACEPSQSGTPGAIRPIAPGNPTPIGVIVASALVVPAQDAQLSFVLSGTVKEVLVMEGDLVKAGQPLMVLAAPEWEYGLVQAEAAARSEEYDYQYWLQPRLDRPPERRQLAKDELVKVQTALDVARAELAQTRLIAPFDGTVVTISAKPGEIVESGQVETVLADLQHLQIETTDLSERDIPRVALGQPAIVYIKSLNNELTGSVKSISPRAEIVSGDVVYKVIIQLDKQSDGLLWGMSAEVRLLPQ